MTFLAIFPPDVRVVKPDGQPTAEFHRFLIDLYRRVGGYEAPGLGEISDEMQSSITDRINLLDMLPPFDNSPPAAHGGISDDSGTSVSPHQSIQIVEFDDVMPPAVQIMQLQADLQRLADMYTELQKELNSLKQGQQL